MDHRCPSCGGLLYSQRSRMCGQCGAVLPREIVLSDEKAEASQKERQWARNLADKFDTTGRRRESETFQSSRARYEAAETSPEDLIRPISCAAEFKRRKRPWFWVLICLQAWLAALILLTGPLVFKVMLPVQSWLVAIGLFFLFGYLSWLRASPVCPNCKQNIRNCITNYCHVCGKAMKERRCADCGVDHTWTGWLRPFENGNHRWIKYCPDCGVELDTCIKRWRGGN